MARRHPTKPGPGRVSFPRHVGPDHQGHVVGDVHDPQRRRSRLQRCSCLLSLTDLTPPMAHPTTHHLHEENPTPPHKTPNPQQNDQLLNLTCQPQTELSRGLTLLQGINRPCCTIHAPNTSLCGVADQHSTSSREASSNHVDHTEVTIAVGVHAVDSQEYSATVKCKSESAASRTTNCCIPFTRLGVAGHLRLYMKMLVVRGEPGATGGNERKPHSRSKTHS